MSPKRPKVTVSIPAYNAESFIVDCIESVLSQDFNDFELIVVDDCSTDSTAELVSDCPDSRLRYLKNERNLGLARTFTRCASEAGGEYVTIFHADDLMLTGNLRKKVAFLDEHSDVAWVHSNAVRFFENEERGLYWNHDVDDPAIESSTRFIRGYLEGENPVIAPSVMFRNTSMQDVGMFNPALSFASDIEMWGRLAMKGDVGYIAEPLLKYRLHAGQDSHNYVQSPKGLREEWLAKMSVFEQAGSLLENHEQIKDRISRTYSCRALNTAERYSVTENKATCRSLLQVARSIRPSVVGTWPYIRLTAKLLLK